jgi:2-C-methyl-D-erythritol 4-phosphate cytidylyltransferase
MFDAIIVMAGTGSRSHLEINKVLYPINGVEIFIYSIRKFQQLEGLDQLILVINPLEEPLIREILKRHRISEYTLVPGGATRPESVRHGLSVSKAPKVLIHDGARPLITPGDIRKVIDALNEWDAVTLVNPVYDTLKQVSDNIITYTIDRLTVRKVVTPQGFRSEMLPYLLNPGISDEMITDETVILEKKVKVFTLASDAPNFKLTTKSDIDLIAYYLSKEEH